MQNFEAEGYEDVEFGALDEVIAGEVAAAQYKNPSSKLSHYFSCLFTFLKDSGLCCICKQNRYR